MKNLILIISFLLGMSACSVVIFRNDGGACSDKCGRYPSKVMFGNLFSCYCKINGNWEIQLD